MRKILPSQSTLFTGIDPLSRLLLGKLQLPAWLATLLFMLVINVPVTLTALFTGNWYDKGGTLGLSTDYGWWTFQLLSVPATIFFFFWLPGGLQAVLAGLKENKVISRDPSADFEPSFDRFLGDFHTAISKPSWSILSLLVAAFFMVFLVPVHSSYHLWTVNYGVIFWFIEAAWFLLAFMLCLNVIRCFQAILWFNRLFREFLLDIRILHPDGSGGLSPLGGFSVRIGYLIGIYGLSIVAAALTQSMLLTSSFSGLELNSPLIIIGITYLVLAPLTFFAPLAAAHKTMKTAKHEFMLQLADQFKLDFARLRSSIQGDSADLKSNLEKIEQMNKVFELARRFPIWPFNTGSIIRFASSVLSPLVLALLPTLIELILP